MKKWGWILLAVLVGIFIGLWAFAQYFAHVVWE
jgi:hypothetical protein